MWLVLIRGSSNDFYEIMDMLDKRLNDKGKNWRHVLKSLKVLDYCLHEGSELVVTWARKNIYIIKTLREFQYVDDDGKDVGQNGECSKRRVAALTNKIVRMSAKELTSLVLDEERLRTERSDRKNWKTRVTGIEEHGPRGSHYTGGSGSSEPPTPNRRRNERRQQRPDEEDAEYKLAIEASKYEAEEDKKRRDRNSAAPVDDDDLAKAIRLSKEEEELRRRELEDSHATSLFDDSPAQPQPTGNNQGYQQQGAVDWFGNPVDLSAQQPQNTGYPGNAYAQPTGFQNQQTGFSNAFQPQPTGFDPNQYQQPPANYLQAQATLQPQQTAFNGLQNPYGPGQPMDLSNQFQQPQQSVSLLPGSHNPWASSQQPQYESLKPAPTGSNNPFASAFNRPPATQQKTSPPSLITLAEQKATTQFSQQSYNPVSSYASSPAPPTPQKEINPQHARLNALLAAGEGTDSFGNVGDLRIPAQHTAPGTFVNSAGQGLNRLHAAQTGTNPFFSQQFTGVPQQPSGFGGPQPTMVPAQTGPAGVHGFGGGSYGQTNNNPFGAQQAHQGQNQQQSLIDI
jgi:epsin